MTSYAAILKQLHFHKSGGSAKVHFGSEGLLIQEVVQPSLEKHLVYYKLKQLLWELLASSNLCALATLSMEGPPRQVSIDLKYLAKRETTCGLKVQGRMLEVWGVSVSFWLTTMWYERLQQKGRGLLYCTSSADGINHKWNVIDIHHWVKKFKVQRLLPSLSFGGFSPRTLVTMAQATKLNYDFHSRPKKATESWRLGWQKDAKSNGNSLAKRFVTLPGVASACAWNILPELLDQIWPEHSWTIEKLQSITSAAFEW